MAVFTKTLRKHIFIHPGEQHKIYSAVRTVLMKDRKKYSDRMGGALLDVSNIKVIGDRHLIVNGYLSMEVMADFQIFAPTIGMTLQGSINKVHNKYCGCVTMDFFNATLSYQEHSDGVPREGDGCSFVVQSLIVNGDMLHLRGQLKSINSSMVSDMSSHTVFKSEELEDSSSQYESPKEKLKKTSQTELQNSSSEIHNASTSELADGSLLENGDGSKKKHKKKSKKDEPGLTAYDLGMMIKSEIGATNESALENNDSSKKKRKEKRKEDSLDFSACNPVIIKSEVETIEEPGLESNSSRKKKHKKKSKERLELSTDTCDITIKTEDETTDESILENNNNSSPKKKHKKKSKEDKLHWNDSANVSDTSFMSSVETTDESMIEKSPRKKHKKKSKESNFDLIDNSFDSEIEESKKKHKKRHRNESGKDSFQNTKKNKFEDD